MPKELDIYSLPISLRLTQENAFRLEESYINNRQALVINNNTTLY
jgi:hypothetical protein